MGYDYDDTNPVINLILELDKEDSENVARKKSDSTKTPTEADLKSLHSIEVTIPALLQNREVLDQADKADRLLRSMKCDSRPKAEFVLQELQRESDRWLHRRDSQAGPQAYISIVALVVSVASLIANVTSGNESQISVTQITFLCLCVATIAAITLLIYIPYSWLRYSFKIDKGKLAKIAELSKAISCWLVVNCDDQPTCSSRQ